MNNKLLRMPSVLEMTGMSESTLRRNIKSNRFPKSFKISQKCIAWKLSDVEAWIKSCSSNGDTK